MSFIDWSDSEGMFGLLVDFVADERAECQDDRDRRRFLSNLSRELCALEAGQSVMSAFVAIQRLKRIKESIDREFAADPVMRHLEDCIEELERVGG